MKTAEYIGWMPLYGEDVDDGRTVRASCVADAAEYFAADLCDSDPDCYDRFGDEGHVRIRSAEGTVTNWLVSMVSSRPTFNATPNR